MGVAEVHPVIGAFDGNNPWFWIVVTVGSALLVAMLVPFGKWVWNTQMNALREWFQAPKAAKENAEIAADHAVKLADAVGHPNGQGNLMAMSERMLANQQKQFDWQREVDQWRIDHDQKDDSTRADVAAIKAHLNLS